MSVIADLKEEVVLQNSKLDNLIKSVRMLNNGSTIFDKILQTGKNAGNVKGLGYRNQAMKNKNSELKFVPQKMKQEQKMSNHMSQHRQKHQKRHYSSMYKPWRCHYCGRFGHLKSSCYRLYGYPKPVIPYRRKYSNVEAEPKSIILHDSYGLIAYTSLKASTREDWYFDSGYSRHMTGVKKFLVDIQPRSTSYFTFGDG